MGKQNMALKHLSLNEYEKLSFDDIQTVAMGNAAPIAVVAANPDRRALIICNVSDATGYFSFGDGTNLSTTVYIKSLGAGAVWEIMNARLSKQAIYAICGAATKNLAIQEAT